MTEPIKILRSDIAASAVSKKQYPALALPQVVLLGRSNSGKSSLINTLLNRKNLARTSSQPGKTRLINFYLAEATWEGKAFQWYFVDLPGYGYAKAAKTERAKWLDFIEEYLSCRKSSLYCWQLVDIRHLPSAEDIAMHQVLDRDGYRMQTIANKTDKLGKNAVAQQLRLIGNALELPAGNLQPFSAVNRLGREELLAKLADFCLDLQAQQAADLQTE